MLTPPLIVPPGVSHSTVYCTCFVCINLGLLLTLSHSCLLVIICGFKHLPVCVPAAMPHCYWIYLPDLTASPNKSKLIYWLLNCFETYMQCHLVQLFIVSCWNINKNGPSQPSFYHGPTPLSYTALTAKMHPERSSCLYSTPVCVLQTRACWVAPWADRTLGHSTLQSCGQMSPCSRSWVFQFFSSTFQF